MRFLITGAAGFLGSALANRLIKEGHSVCGLDDLSAGTAGALSLDVKFEKGDVNDRAGLWSLLKNVDCVYHLAAKVLVPESVLHPSDYNKVNVGGTVTLMESIRDVGVKRVVFISSGAVYGVQSEQPMKETAIPQPRSPYAVSKLASEYYINTIGSLWGIETVCLRVFNAYGPGQQMPPVHTPVIPSFLRQACQNGTIVAHSDGTQTRDYVYIDDVVNAMISAATASDINQTIINIGSGQETSIRELFRLVLEITGGHPEVVYNPHNEGGPSRMCADISLARQKLNYQPQIPLPVGLRMTLARDLRFTQKANGNGHA
jgi:UDP-glucose 4-epimerase